MKPSTADFITYNNRLFARIAPYYDAFELVIHNVRNKFVRFLDPPPGCSVLDVATGTGRQALAFARRGCRVTALDLSPAMLARARRRAAHPRITWTQALSSALAFRDGAFEFAVMSFALHCMPLAIRQATVAEMVRVTKPHGSVAFVDYGVPENAVLRTMARRVIELYETDLYREFIRSDFEALLAASGLVVVRRQSLFLGSMQMLQCRRRQEIVDGAR